MNTNTPLEARLMLAAPDGNSGRFMFMPAGVHTCHLSRAGVPVTVTVKVEPVDAALALNAQLSLVQANRAPQRPYCDFNHDRDKASFWPERFEAAADGVYVVGEFSSSGKAAVSGKDYRGFSPTFFTNAEIPDKPMLGKDRIEVPAGRIGSDAKPAHIVCNPQAGLNFGGLVNEPAFRTISPLWAKNAGESGDVVNNTDTDEMKKTIAELQAAKANLENQVRALEAKATKTEVETAQLEARKAELNAADQSLKIAELEARENARAVADAEAAVARAVKRGAIPAQNTELQAKWKNSCAANPDSIAMLDAIAADGPAAALTAKATPGASSGVTVTGIGPAEAAKRLVELQAKNAGISDMRNKIIHAKEVHALWAKEIRGNKDFEAMPLDAATPADNIGTLAGTLVAQRTLEFYKYQFPVLSMITSDYSDQPAQYNQTTTSRIITAPAIMTYSATVGSDGRAAGWTIGTQAVTTDASITINAHKAVEINFDANTLGSTVRRLFDEQAEASQYTLGKDLVDALYAVITAANFSTNTAFTEASVDFGRRTFSKASRILNNQGVPFANRFALINSTYFEKLEQDPTLISLAVYQKPQIIEASQLPAISRFIPIEAPNLPTTGNMAAFFGHRSSLMIQGRIPNDYTTVLGPAASYGQVTVVTNPDTGMSALLTQYVSHHGGYAGWRLAWMYGVAKGNEKGGQIVKSS